jgi:hypothetical protein
MLPIKLFRLVFCLFRFNRNNRNSLFRYRSETTETNVLFRIVPKLVSVPVSVVSLKIVSKDTLVRCLLNGSKEGLCSTLADFFTKYKWPANRRKCFYTSCHLKNKEIFVFSGKSFGTFFKNSK